MQVLGRGRLELRGAGRARARLRRDDLADGRPADPPADGRRRARRSRRLRDAGLAGARVAIVHDWLQGMHGSERTVEAMITTVFRDAERCDVFTFHAAHDVLSATLSAAVVRDAALTRLPGIRQRGHDPGRWRLLAALHDAVVRVAGARRLRRRRVLLARVRRRRPPAPAGVLHACYCYTPIRYVWERDDRRPADRRGPSMPRRRRSSAACAARICAPPRARAATSRSRPPSPSASAAPTDATRRSCTRRSRSVSSVPATSATPITSHGCTG